MPKASTLPRVSVAPVATVTPARYSDAAVNTAHLLILIRQVLRRADRENGLPDRFEKLEQKDTKTR